MPGVGPAFSLKDACDGVGHLRASFNYHSGTENELLAPKKCDSHHEKCEELPFDDKVSLIIFIPKMNGDYLNA